MPISRSTSVSVAALGIPWAGPLPGGGYEGATPALDRAVQRHARALQAWLGRRVRIEIRFNSDRESGGAWVWDGDGLGSSCTLGLTAGIEPDNSLTPNGEWVQNPRASRLYHRVYLEHTLARPNVTLRPDDEDWGNDDHYSILVRGTADGIRLLKRLVDPKKLARYLRAIRRGRPTARPTR